MFPTIYLPGPRILLNEAVINLDAELNGANYGASVAAITAVAVLYTAQSIHSELEITWVPDDYGGGPLYQGWSAWGVPNYTGASTGSSNWSAVLKDDTLPVQALGAAGPNPNQTWSGYAAAMAGFRATEPRYISGHITYRFLIQDDPLWDNSGGVSLLVREYSRAWHG